MNLTACKKMCNECPFHKDSPAGWLGDHSIEEITNAIQFEQLFSCHKQRGESPALNRKEMENGDQNICRGFLLSATKSCKMFGQNPDTGKELRRLQDELEISDEERENVLSKWDFAKHHSI